MFTNDNTNGSFTNEELKTLNSALEIMLSRGYDEGSASDKINNAWFEGATANDLVGGG